jgi:hypothetical protein
MTYQTADILPFKGNGLFSTIIMAAPGAEYSHVGMFVDHPEYGPCVFESTSLGTLPDVITGKKICGVQLVPFEQRVESYDGEVFHRPIIGERTPEQIQGILDFIDTYHGTPYEADRRQLANAQLDIPIFPWQKNKPDASTLFCSETVVMCQRSAGIIIDDGMPANEFTPTDCSDDHLVLNDGFQFGDIALI